MNKLLVIAVITAVLLTSCNYLNETEKTVEASASIASSASSSSSSLAVTSSSQASISSSASSTSLSKAATSSSTAAASSKVVSKASSTVVSSSKAVASSSSQQAAISSSAIISSSSSSSLAASSSSSSSVATNSSKAVASSSSEQVVSSSSQQSSSSSSQVENPVIKGDNFLSSVESEIIDYINAERQSLGLSILEYNQDLRSAARIRSRELLKAGIFEHKRPNGDEWYTVVQQDIKINFLVAGENLAEVEFDDPNANYHKDASRWFQQWKNSPPHYENITKPEYTHIGLGVYYENSNGKITAVATTVFAKLP